jgi:hypothetical protein
MAEQIDVQTLQLRERIAVAAAAAMFVAGVILVTVILPAEYGVDPTGTGRVFGLLEMGQAQAATPAAMTGTGGTGLSELEAVRPGANTPQTVRFRRDTKTFEIGPREGIEYKYTMERGGSFVYTWSATGEVAVDFHGEPRGAPQGTAEFYDQSKGRSASGSFFAPTSGIHGWWWENQTDQPITVTLETSGFYSDATEFRATGITKPEIPD